VVVDNYFDVVPGELFSDFIASSMLRVGCWFALWLTITILFQKMN